MRHLSNLIFLQLKTISYATFKANISKVDSKNNSENQILNEWYYIIHVKLCQTQQNQNFICISCRQILIPNFKSKSQRMTEEVWKTEV